MPATYNLRRNAEGSTISGAYNEPLATFSHDTAGDKLLGLLVTAIASNGGAIFDVDRDQYLAGNLDELLA